MILTASMNRPESPSSRRAWIEIVVIYRAAIHFTVALLAEGVDRNLLAMMVMVPSLVALLAEGVDRNRISPGAGGHERSRPPRGGRG